MSTSIMDKFYEADDVGTRGASGTAGSLSQNYTISSGELWHITAFGGSADIDQTEVELLYSEDGGSTFTNPYDSTTDKIRCLHLQNGLVAKVILDLYFTGNSTTVLQLKVKNYNNVNAAEITGFITGTIRI